MKMDPLKALMSEGEDPKLDAAKDALGAFKAGDAKALSLALERHYEACAGGADDESEDEEY